MRQKALAILYDFLQVPGGAEAVTLLLRDRFPGSEVWVAGVNRTFFPPQSLSRVFPLSHRPPPENAAWRALSTALRFQWAGKSLDQYQSVLFSGHYAPLAAEMRQNGGNLLYCHTEPLPFALDLYDNYRAQFGWWHRGAFATMCSWLRSRYASAVRGMDFVIANSEFVEAAYVRHYGISPMVIHPPCNLSDLRWENQQGYYLSIARLEDQKRVDRIIRAFLELPDKRLIVASDGSAAPRLRQLAAGASNIRFTGTVNRDSLRSLLGQCVATLLVPWREPFGISAVESMAAGKPVIGVREGGIPETVLDGETGILLPSNPSPDAIRQAVLALPPPRATAMRTACEARAQLFGTDIFIRRMRELI